MDRSIFSSRRNRYAAPIGGVFIILCFVGFFTVAGFCLDLTRSLLDNTRKKQEYETMLLPVVIFDPVPFENPVNIDNSSLLQYCIWATAMGEKRDQYEYDDSNMVVIPASDIDVTALRLFGPDVKLDHRSFGDMENSYFYEDDIRSYHVPIITMTGFATPKVEEINKTSGDVIQLKVGYVPPSSILDLNASGQLQDPEPQKYMIYELHRSKNGWYLYAVKATQDAGDMPGGDMMPLPEIPGEDVITMPGVVPELADNAGNVPPPEGEGEEGEDPDEENPDGEDEGEDADGGDEEDEDGEDEDNEEEDGEGDEDNEPAPEIQG